MARKQLSDIERLRHQAEDLWEQQQDVLQRARDLAREAGRRGVATAVPRLQQAVGTGADAVRSLTDSARDRVQRDVVPSLSTALGGAIATIDALRDKQLRPALSRLPSLRVQPPVVVTKPRSSSAGLWVGIGIGVVAAAAVGYVVWQTLRADDDLWIEDEAEAAPIEAAEPEPVAED